MRRDKAKPSDNEMSNHYDTLRCQCDRYSITLRVNPLSKKVTVKLHVRSSYNQVLNRNPDVQLYFV